jgi:hypothetical protein
MHAPFLSKQRQYAAQLIAFPLSARLTSCDSAAEGLPEVAASAAAATSHAALSVMRKSSKPPARVHATP